MLFIFAWPFCVILLHRSLEKLHAGMSFPNVELLLRPLPALALLPHSNVCRSCAICSQKRAKSEFPMTILKIRFTRTNEVIVNGGTSESILGHQRRGLEKFDGNQLDKAFSLLFG